MRIVLYIICMLIAPCGSHAAGLFNSRTVHYPKIYNEGWSKLPNGKCVPKLDVAGKKITEISGDGYRREYLNQDKVVLKDIRVGVHWKNVYHKYNNALFLIRNCNQVVVDGIYIEQLDADYRASNGLLIEDCGQVIVKNSYFAGTTGNYHIRIEGCEKVLIDNVEIEGLNYPGNGVRCGGGIFINNGDPKMGGIRGMQSPSPKDLKWCVIQNSYIHNNLATDEWRNQDGILVHSASNGLIFNCYFEKWQKGDAAIDVSHRRSDADYLNHFFRIERNVFDNCDKIKTPGNSHPSNTIFFANNIYLNTFICDYHSGWDVYHVHETFVYNNHYEHSVLFSIWGIKNGLSYLQDSLVFVSGKELRNVFYQKENVAKDDYKFIRPDHIVFVMPKPAYWLKGKDVEIKKWKKWRTDFGDIESKFFDVQKIFVDLDRKDYRLLPGSIAVNTGSGHFLREGSKKVMRDFSGKLRPKNPSAGAFEVYNKETDVYPPAPSDMRVIDDNP